MCISTMFCTRRLRLAVDNRHSIIETAKLWLYSSDYIMTRGSPEEPLHTYIYICPCLHTGMYVLYFHTTELSNGQVFHEVQVIRLLSIDQSMAMLRANGHANYLSVKIAALELTKKTVDVTNYIDEGRDQETEEEMIRW